VQIIKLQIDAVYKLNVLFSIEIFFKVEDRAVWISRRWDVGIWTGLGWPRIETGGGRL